MSTTAEETKRVAKALEATAIIECPVCGGGWLEIRKERVADIHHVECPRRGTEPDFWRPTDECPEC